jgi:hypothetical protein
MLMNIALWSFVDRSCVDGWMVTSIIYKYCFKLFFTYKLFIITTTVLCKIAIAFLCQLCLMHISVYLLSIPCTHLVITPTLEGRFLLFPEQFAAEVED